MQAPERRQWPYSGANIVNLEHSESTVSIVDFEHGNGGCDSDIRITF